MYLHRLTASMKWTQYGLRCDTV